MPEASSIPGYAQGFRFSDAPAFYNSSTKRFIDQSPFRTTFPENDLVITTGTPTFVTDATGERGMTLDNTCQGDFLPAIPWEGSVVAVMRPTIVGATTQTLRVVVFGSATTASSNGNLIATANSGAMQYQYNTAGSANASTINRTGQTAMSVVGFATDQSTRKGYRTTDGITVTDTAAVAAANNGNALAIAYHTSTTPNAQRVRFGNLTGTIGDTTATASSLTIFELHFWTDNIWINSPVEAQAFMSTIRTKYSIT